MLNNRLEVKSTEIATQLKKKKKNFPIKLKMFWNENVISECSKSQNISQFS